MATFSNMISVFLCFVFFVSTGSSAPLEDDTQNNLTSYINLFSSDLFQEVSNEKDHVGKNLVMSAMSADMVLAMLSLGAKGKTLDEINNGLHLPNSNFTKAAYKTDIDNMNAYQYVTLNLAFKVYVKEGGEKYEINPIYKIYVNHFFGSEVENIDFEKSAAAAAEINHWVEEKTKKTVKDIVEAADFNDNTALELINTIYFKGTWELQFDPHNTAKESFNVSATKEIQVDMMFQQNHTNYAESAELDAKMLELNFEGDETSMVFILPNKVDGLAELEEKLAKNYTKLKDMYDSLQTEEVMVLLPKFETETTIDLNAALSNLGMKTMFSKKAELEDLVVGPTPPIQVHKVIQKAHIYVNEKGVTAGAGTAVNSIYFDSSKNTKIFHANHPFCYGLLNSDGQIVFSGHFTGEQ